MASYPCFISFRHFGDPISEAFVTQFFDSLKAYLNPLIGKAPFIDFDRMKAGYGLKPALADAICNSVCMIVIWSPQYFNEEHIWCTMEYKAMMDLEKKRLAMLPQNQQYKKLIIPVIYKGSKYYPEELSEETLYLNFEKFALFETEMIKNKNFATEIEKLAEYIYERITEFQDNGINPFGNCNQFTLPSKQDAIDFIRTDLKKPQHEFPFR